MLGNREVAYSDVPKGDRGWVERVPAKDDQRRSSRDPATQRPSQAGVVPLSFELFWMPSAKSGHNKYRPTQQPVRLQKWLVLLRLGYDPARQRMTESVADLTTYRYHASVDTLRARIPRRTGYLGKYQVACPFPSSGPAALPPHNVPSVA